MKYIFLLICLFSSGFVLAQDEDEFPRLVFNSPEFKDFQSAVNVADSVKIVLYDYATWDNLNVRSGERKAPKGLVKESKLGKKDIALLNKYFTSPSSYRSDNTLLGHVYVGFLYYKGGEVQYEVVASSLTCNITILNKEKRRVVDGGITSKIFYHIRDILKRKNMWDSSLQVNF